MSRPVKVTYNRPDNSPFPFSYPDSCPLDSCSSSSMCSLANKSSSSSQSPSISSSSSTNSNGESWSSSPESDKKFTDSLIGRNVDKLGFLADTCERLNTNLSSIVTESHKILDNSFLSSQTHLTDHISDLNYQACLDIVTAMGTYTEFITVTNELMEAEDIYFREILRGCNELNTMSDELFCKLNKEAVERMAKHDDKEDDVNEGICDAYAYAYDDLTIFECLDT
eukprot:GFUD01112808.1.p1 GENE.GFUD01112808.1~~GFUD01112808.1.p1  ORF type:complete len:225 (-),score=64.29 GFUD01112808.1:37-711(-)